MSSLSRFKADLFFMKHFVINVRVRYYKTRFHLLDILISFRPKKENVKNRKEKIIQ